MKAAMALRPLAVLGLFLWALGMFLGEGLSQLGFALSALWVLPKRPWVGMPPRLRMWALLCVALAAWQALSPLCALDLPWPRSGRYFQFFDTLGPVIALGAAQLPVSHRALWGLLGAGTLTNFLVAAYQHFFTWTFDSLFFFRAQVDRVREVFSVDGVARHGAGGLLFHRLRYAHGALALLGPFLSFFLAPQKAPLGRRGWNLAVALQLSLAGYLAFARAATLTTLLLWCAVLLLWVGGRWRWGALLWVVAVAGGLAFQPSWRQRAQAGVENLLSGERALAMSVGLEVARAHPLWGVGFGNHQKAAFATSARTGITEYLSTDSHNLWLTTWAETGLVGLGLLFLSHLFLGRLLWEASSRHVVGRGAFLSWCAFHLLSCVHYLPYHTGVYLSFALVWGLGLHAGVAAAPSTPVEEKAASAT